MVCGTLTFISGGVRSGKSAHAEKRLVDEAMKSGKRLVYIASGTATDVEMKKRIRQHQADRSAFQWVTIEQPTNIEEVLPQLQTGDLIVWDCVTTWLANELYVGWETGTPCIGQANCMERKVAAMLRTVEKIVDVASSFVIVSNEVLDDIDSYAEETEVYRKWLGQIHQQLVARAHNAIEMVYGIPVYHRLAGEIRTS